MPRVYQGDYPGVVEGAISSLGCMTPLQLRDFYQKEANEATIQKDLPRVCVLGVKANFLQAWKQHSLQYTQGDLTGGALNAIILQSWVCLEAVKKETRDDQERFQVKFSPLHDFRFGYLNARGQACGFGLAVSKGDPNFWVIVHMENANAEPMDRKVTVYVSDKIAEGMKPEVPVPKQGLFARFVDWLQTTRLKGGGKGIVAKVLSAMVSPFIGWTQTWKDWRASAVQPAPINTADIAGSLPQLLNHPALSAMVAPIFHIKDQITQLDPDYFSRLEAYVRIKDEDVPVISADAVRQVEVPAERTAQSMQTLSALGASKPLTPSATDASATVADGAGVSAAPETPPAAEPAPVSTPPRSSN